MRACARYRSGAWEGLTVEEIKGRDAADVGAPRGGQVAPRGAGRGKLRMRGCPRRRVARVSTHGDLLVVTHGAVDRILRGLYAGLSHEEICALPEPQDEIFRLQGGRITVL